MIIRVLVLGDEYVIIPQDLRETPGLEFELICETPEEIMTDYLYRVSDRSQQLAQGATPEAYDAIIIDNNMGTGLSKADRVPPNMLDRTLIVWNTYVPGTERPYARMGFTRFGQRVRLAGETPYSISDFLRELVAAKSGTGV